MAPASAEREREETKGVEPSSFLSRLYDLSEASKVDEAITGIIHQFDHWLEQGNWLACKQALAGDVGRLHPAIALAMLSMTLVEKQRLGAARQGFYDALHRKLVETYGEEEAQDALRGLA
jgi:hypothetical protein